MSKTLLEEFYRPLNAHSHVFFGLRRIKNAVQEWPMTYDVDFQRGHVWTQEQQAKFIGYLLEGGIAPQVVVNNGPQGDLVPAEIVDGKQRVFAATEWADNKIPALLFNGREIWESSLDVVSKRIVNTSIGLNFAMTQLSRLEALEVYIRLNRGGTPHTQDEIVRVEKLLKKEQSNSGTK